MRKGALAIVILLLVPFLACAGEELLDVYFIDVGHGDAILVKYGTTEWLIDTGYKNAWPSTSICSVLLGVEVDLPIEYFILSHADLDHYSALDLFMCPCLIQTVASSLDPCAVQVLVDDVGQALDCDPSAMGAPAIDSLTTDSSIVYAGSGLSWRVLHPSSEFANSSANTNNKSVVLLLTYGSVSFLFPGDIEETGEQVLQETPLPIGTLVLKVAHHGSNTSTHLDFLRWADPEIAIVSSDDDDMHATTTANLGKLGIPYLTTHANGTICVSTDGNAVWVTMNPPYYPEPI